QLSELLAAPVSTSLAGNSAFDEPPPLSIGAGGAASPGQLRHFLDHSDVILGIGCSFLQTSFGVRMPEGKRVIHATLNPADFNSGVECEIALAGDAKLVLAALIEAVRSHLSSPRAIEPVAAEISKAEGEWM